MVRLATFYHATFIAVTGAYLKLAPAKVYLFRVNKKKALEKSEKYIPS